MSASSRKISRLPLTVFQNLITRSPVDGHDGDPERLKAVICDRLKKIVVRTSGKKPKRRSIIDGISSPSTCSITTIGQLLRISKQTLLILLDPILTYEEVLVFLERCCNQCSPKPISVLRLLDQWRCDQSDPIKLGISMKKIPSNIYSLDRILRGGIRVTNLTEIVGKAGTGKSQLACQFCISAARFNQGAIYIDTEKKLSLQRLKEMADRWKVSGEVTLQQHSQDWKNNLTNIKVKRHTAHKHSFSYNRSSFDGAYNTSAAFDSQLSAGSCRSSNIQDRDVDDDVIGMFKSSEFVLNNLTIHQPNNTDELLDVLDSVEDEVLNRNQAAGQNFLSPHTMRQFENNNNEARRIRGKYAVRLLVVDSIASPMKRDFGSGSAPQRASAIFQFAQKVKRLADQLHLAIIVINQVGVSSSTPSDGSTPNSFCPALGTSFHHCVTTRLVMDACMVSDSFRYENSLENRYQSINDIDSNSLSPKCINKIRGCVTRKISVVKSNNSSLGEVDVDVKTLGIVESSSRYHRHISNLGGPWEQN